MRLKALLAGCVVGLFCGGSLAADAEPLLVRVPNRGVQPQAVTDNKGVLHLVYLAGEDGASDVYYVRRAPGAEEFTKPIRVNSQPRSAVAVGTIRGAHLALGKGNRVHVAWNGSSAATQKSAKDTMPMLYARMDDNGTAFEPQRNLMTQSFVLDGGGTVAADAAGNVYVAWHGLPVGSAPGEINRKIWVARSTDEGKSFAPEAVATEQKTGVCGCCGMRGFVDSRGDLYFLFRSATDQVNRDIYLLRSQDQGKSFQCSLIHPWKVSGCPMSSEAFAEANGKVFAAWETQNRVYFGELTAQAVTGIVEAPGSSSCKLPTLAVGPNGDILLAWAEGTGWKKGGALAWQIFDAAGKPTVRKGRVEGGIPVWGAPTAFVQRDGRFVIYH